jgi:two-component system response regulator HydG
MRDTAFVLIVEDEAAHGEALAEALQRANFVCHVVDNGKDAVESLRQRAPDVVVTDYRLGGSLTGMDVLREAKRVSPETEVILMTAYGNESLAREALSGDSDFRAYDYLIKPLDVEVVREKVTRAAQQALAARESKYLREQITSAFEFYGIVGSSELMQREIKRLHKLARTKATLLIIGETGTGKELFAQAIHQNSPRAAKAFRVLNCAAVSETLLESELFGHVKGAFTGAVTDKKGLIEAADGGTMFLDEIGDMPYLMQAKLLRTLETGEVMRVGSSELRHFDVRFVAATNRDLAQLMREGKFREDLYYRLAGDGALRIPPLRNRREDIPALAQRFIDAFNRENGTKIEGLTPEAMRRLVNHNWPGNVRELKNVVERMCIESESALLDVGDLPDSLRTTTDIVPTGAPNLTGLTMADVERLHIMNTLRFYSGNRERTAKALGIGARTLYRKLRDYGLR